MGVAQGCKGIWAQRPGLEETGRQAAYCKHTAQGSTNRLTHAVTCCHYSVSYSTSLIQTYTLHTYTHVGFYSLPVLCLLCLFICLFDFVFLFFSLAADLANKDEYIKGAVQWVEMIWPQHWP